MKAIVGLSGGIDSTWALKLAMEDPGIDVIATVTFKNGWETSEAISNIKKACEYFDVPNIVHTVDSGVSTREFYEIQKAFLLASVPDAECPTDLTIKAYLLIEADFQGCQIITGGNRQTEGQMPSEWSMIDYTYLKNVCKAFNVELYDFPVFNIIDTLRYKRKVYRILEGVDYDPEYAKGELNKMFGYLDYGGKHCESIYTRFVKALRYYKFGIDVRSVELRAKVDTGLMSVIDMIVELNYPIVNSGTFLSDWAAVEREFNVNMDMIMRLPIKSYKDYGISIPRRVRQWLK